jgi:hypothetical protein
LSSVVLNRSALNRAVLARQLLLERAAMPAADALEHLVGLQSQAPNPPFVGLWTRLAGFDAGELSQMMLERSAVRIALMRSTIFVVTARDCLALRPLLQPVLLRGLRGNFGRQLEGLDLEALAVAGREVVEERPRTFSQIGSTLVERWPDRDPQALAIAVRAIVPLVQVTPRGVWGRGGPAAHTSAEAWLGRPLDNASIVDGLILRYVGAFGPATVMDAQVWSGLQRLGEVFDRLRPTLLTFRDEQGRELFDLPDAPRPDPESPAPVRFLPQWENLLLSHADRTRVISDENRARINTDNGVMLGTVLVDGFVSARWDVTQSRVAASLRIEQMRTLSADEKDAITAEGERLLEFMAPDVESRNLEI